MSKSNFFKSKKVGKKVANANANVAPVPEVAVVDSDGFQTVQTKKPTKKVQVVNAAEQDDIKQKKVGKNQQRNNKNQQREHQNNNKKSSVQMHNNQRKKSGGKAAPFDLMSEVFDLTNKSHEQHDDELPLADKWSIWYKEAANNYRGKNVDKNETDKRGDMKEWLQFSTVESLFLARNAVKAVFKDLGGVEIAVFKKGIAPTWDEPQNKGGSRIAVSSLGGFEELRYFHKVTTMDHASFREDITCSTCQDENCFCARIVDDVEQQELPLYRDTSAASTTVSTPHATSKNDNIAASEESGKSITAANLMDLVCKDMPAPEGLCVDTDCASTDNIPMPTPAISYCPSATSTGSSMCMSCEAALTTQSDWFAFW